LQRELSDAKQALARTPLRLQPAALVNQRQAPAFMRRSILRKLAAPRRSDAVRRARELQLV